MFYDGPQSAQSIPAPASEVEDVAFGVWFWFFFRLRGASAPLPAHWSARDASARQREASAPNPHAPLISRFVGVLRISGCFHRSDVFRVLSLPSPFAPRV
jgi:hypothetical protein